MSIPVWIPVTVAAASFQVWRTALQARLRGEIAAGPAGFVRYVYALPVDIALLLLAFGLTGADFPRLSARFLVLCLGGGIAQIVGTILLISAFGFRNFVVGTAYAKTEAAQLVIVSIFLLGIALPPAAIAGILLAVAGVLVLSLADKVDSVAALLKATVQPAALCGLGAGAAFAATALALRAAALTLPTTLPVLLKALLVLTVTNALQTLAQGGYMAIATPAALGRCFALWRRAAPVGVLSALGSGCWFAGFALTDVALVRGLGQIEILFTVAVGHFFLHERIRRGEIAGIVLVGLGVVLIAAGGIG